MDHPTRPDAVTARRPATPPPGRACLRNTHVPISGTVARTPVTTSVIRPDFHHHGVSGDFGFLQRVTPLDRSRSEGDRGQRQPPRNSVVYRRIRKGVLRARLGRQTTNGSAHPGPCGSPARCADRSRSNRHSDRRGTRTVAPVRFRGKSVSLGGSTSFRGERARADVDQSCENRTRPTPNGVEAAGIAQRALRQTLMQTSRYVRPFGNTLHKGTKYHESPLARTP
jgi:hypothetical protein